MKHIKNRKTITVYNNSIASTTNSFSFFLFVHFQPDEVIVKSAALAANQDPNQDIVLVNSDLVDTNYLFSVTNEYYTTPLNIVHPISRPINGMFTFNTSYINPVAGTNATIYFEGIISFTLEFIQYE